MVPSTLAVEVFSVCKPVPALSKIVVTFVPVTFIAHLSCAIVNNHVMNAFRVIHALKKLDLTLGQVNFHSARLPVINKV